MLMPPSATALLASTVSPASWVSSLASTAGDMSFVADPPSALASFKTALASLQPAVPSSQSPATMRDLALGIAMNASAQTIAAGEIARATAKTSFGDRLSAQAAVKVMISAVGPVLELAYQKLNEAVYSTLDSAVSLATMQLSSTWLDLAPVVQVQTSELLPAIVAAYALYGDPARTDELVGRNNCGTPFFLPLEFEALAK